MSLKTAWLATTLGAPSGDRFRVLYRPPFGTLRAVCRVPRVYVHV